MECSRCGSHNVKTFEMAYASFNVGLSLRDALVRVLLLGPLGLLIKPRRNRVADITAPPQKPFALSPRIFFHSLFNYIRFTERPNHH